MPSNNFYEKMYPTAQTIHMATGGRMFISVLLGQMALETREGTSRVFLEDNNGAGINFVPGVSIASGSDGRWAKYFAYSEFGQDYVRVITLPGHGYPEVLAATTIEEQVAALSRSGWDAGHYGGNGANILAIIKNNNLEQYDHGVVTTPTPSPGVNNASNFSKDTILQIGLAVIGIAELLQSGKK